MSKHHSESPLPALRLFIQAQNKAIKSGFTDNGGANQSVERILSILCQRLVNPHRPAH